MSTLWVHTIVITTLHPLHSWHHTHYIRHYTHDNTKVISAISPSISDTTLTVSVSSDPVYQLYYTHSLNDITHYMYDITFSMHDIIWTLYDITPILVWHHIHYIYDIVCNIYEITHTVSWNQNDCTWNLTHCISHHSHCICVVTPALSMPSQQLFLSLHTWHTYDIMHTLHHIKFILYDINHQYLGHHKHCIHDIRSPIYDITSTVYDISSPMPVIWQPLYM